MLSRIAILAAYAVFLPLGLVADACRFLATRAGVPHAWATMLALLVATFVCAKFWTTLLFPCVWEGSSSSVVAQYISDCVQLGISFRSFAGRLMGFSTSVARISVELGFVILSFLECLVALGRLLTEFPRLCLQLVLIAVFLV